MNFAHLYGNISLRQEHRSNALQVLLARTEITEIGLGRYIQVEI